ncbi:MAG: hypothetical protein OXF55_18695 [Caldilineaceae bacterium]|nr:hypothetical protein [Caldilineaceae bacterium]
MTRQFSFLMFEERIPICLVVLDIQALHALRSGPECVTAALITHSIPKKNRLHRGAGKRLVPK